MANRHRAVLAGVTVMTFLTLFEARRRYDIGRFTPGLIGGFVVVATLIAVTRRASNNESDV